MASIHPSSIVDQSARIADDVEIGPFCIIGPEVEIGPRTVLMSHITVRGHTTIGSGNRIFQGAAIGCEPQDKKYAGEDTRLVIGDDNVIRENCTLSTGTIQDQGITIVGSRNLFMANTHIAHDCVIGNDTIMANNTGLAGHVHVEDFVVIGGQSGVHQFVRIGAHAMLGGASGVLRDVPPYVICAGYPAEPHGLNLVGMRRCGMTNDTIRLLQSCYHAVYREGNLIADAVNEIEKILSAAPQDDKPRIEHFLEFIKNSPRGIIR